MLSKKEKAVMKAIYYEASTNSQGTCIMRPIDILRKISTKVEIKADNVYDIVEELRLDDYYEVVHSNKHGETYWCFTLHQKGHAFYREILNEKRWVTFKIVLSIALTFSLFFLRMILNVIFSA